MHVYHVCTLFMLLTCKSYVLVLGRIPAFEWRLRAPLARVSEPCGSA